MSWRFEATYYRTALLLGLVQGDAVHRWAERLIERESSPPHEILELVLIPATDLSAMRHALWPLVIDPEPPEVLRGILELISADFVAGRRSAEDTVTVLRQMRSMLRLPAPLYSELNQALVAHGLAKGTGGTIGTWLQRFAPGAGASSGDADPM